MKHTSLLLFVVMSLLVDTALSQDGKKHQAAASSAAKKADGAGLHFTEEGQDLLVGMLIEGPADRQVVLTDYLIDNGKPRWDEPPIGVDKPRRSPRVELRYLVIINRNRPGFVDPGPMAVPTPPDVRIRQRQKVTWRLKNFVNYDFQREDATFWVEGTRFEASSDQLRQVWPKVKELAAK